MTNHALTPRQRTRSCPAAPLRVHDWAARRLSARSEGGSMPLSDATILDAVGSLVTPAAGACARGGGLAPRCWRTAPDDSRLHTAVPRWGRVSGPCSCSASVRVSGRCRSGTGTCPAADGAPLQHRPGLRGPPLFCYAPSPRLADCVLDYLRPADHWRNNVTKKVFRPDDKKRRGLIPCPGRF
jgi:hypothetical protein